jgi:hypothetical protein
MATATKELRKDPLAGVQKSAKAPDRDGLEVREMAKFSRFSAFF